MRMNIVRQNLLKDKSYTPYCGGSYPYCSNPRTFWNGSQFECHHCGWVSQFDSEFIATYMLQHGYKIQ